MIWYNSSAFVSIKMPTGVFPCSVHGVFMTPVLNECNARICDMHG